MEWIMNLRIDQRTFLTTIDIVSVVVLLYLLLRKPTKRWIITALVALVGGAAVGWLVCWVTVDLIDLFGVDLTPVTRMWVALGFAGVALAIANLWRSRWWRKPVAVLAIPLFLATAAAGINIDFGAYRNLNDAVGVNPYPALALHSESGAVENVGTDYTAGWKAPASMPLHGETGTVDIPGTVSHFAARPAVVYLPPAALTPDPPALPVLIAFAGQPGAPTDMFTSGRINTLVDRYAAAHGGIAPIVVAPDQLSRPDHNPMCVDSPLGNSATYVMTDVLNWVRAHFKVSSDKDAWAIAGYSQGATCAVQFVAGHPDVFGAALAISSEDAPTIGADTVARGFGGSKSAYAAARPAALFALHEPFPGTMMVFAAGADDLKYTAFASELNANAKAAGVTTTLISSPNSAHDWNTVRYALGVGFPLLAAHFGLAS